jgi:hypothetical protein
MEIILTNPLDEDGWQATVIDKDTGEKLMVTNVWARKCDALELAKMWCRDEKRSRCPI